MPTHHSSSRHHHHNKHRKSSLRPESISFDAHIGEVPPVAVVQKGSTGKKVRKHKATKSSVRKMESFITNYLFLALGVIFLIGSLWWLYDSNSNTQNGSLWNNIIKYLLPVNKTNNEKTDITFPFLWKIYIPFLLGYLFLLISILIKNTRNNISKYLTYIAVLYLFIIHFKILYYDGFWGDVCYPNHYVALFISLFIFVSTTIISLYLKHPKTNLIAIPCFYISLFLIILFFGLKIYYLMPSVLLVTIFVYFLSFKQNYRPLNIWNFIFAWIFISIFWLRKIVAFNTTDYLLSFLLFGSLFYILSQLIIILGNKTTILSKKESIKNIFLLTFNLGLLITMSLFALNKFGYKTYEGVFSFGVVLINVLFIYRIIKNNVKTNLFYFYYSSIFLLSLSVALIFNNNYLIIFTAIFSVSLLIYSKKTRDQIAVLMSLGSAAIMFLVFLFSCLFVYIPAAFSGSILNDKEVLFRGLISGLFASLVLFTNNQILKKIYISFSDDWFKRNTIRIYINLFFVFSLYVVLFYAFQYIFLFTTKTLLISSLSWYIFNCIFLIILIYLAGRKVRTIFILSILIFAAFSILLYPLYVHYNIRDIRNTFLTNHELFISGFGLHYIAVFLTLYLLFVIYHRIKRKFSGNKIIFRVYYSFSSLIFLFFMLSEYDHLSFIQAFRKGELTQQLASSNSHLPYSILLIISSLLILAIAFIKRFRFVRFIGVTIFSIALIKILLFDFEVLSNASKVILSFLLGAILILISLYYSKFKRLFLHKYKKS